MRKDTHSNPHAGVGMASVMMIVLVLALTTFGVLSLVSARADETLSRKATENIRAYYEAEGRLAEQLADLDGDLAAGRKQMPKEGSLTLTEEVQDGRKLVLELAGPGPGCGGRFEVLSLRLVNTTEWTPDESLEIWDGGI